MFKCENCEYFCLHYKKCKSKKHIGRCFGILDEKGSPTEMNGKNEACKLFILKGTLIKE